MRLLVATNNTDKLSEILSLLEDLHLDIVTPQEVGINLDIEEHGNTYEENATASHTPLVWFLWQMIRVWKWMHWGAYPGYIQPVFPLSLMQMMPTEECIYWSCYKLIPNLGMLIFIARWQ
jgi:hypothetical protein